MIELLKGYSTMMSGSSVLTKAQLVVEIRRVGDICTYISKLRESIPVVKDLKTKRYYQEELDKNFYLVQPQLVLLKSQILEFINKNEEIVDIGMFSILRSMDWVKV